MAVHGLVDGIGKVNLPRFCDCFQPGCYVDGLTQDIGRSKFDVADIDRHPDLKPFLTFDLGIMLTEHFLDGHAAEDGIGRAFKIDQKCVADCLDYMALEIMEDRDQQTVMGCEEFGHTVPGFARGPLSKTLYVGKHYGKVTGCHTSIPGLSFSFGISSSTEISISS